MAREITEAEVAEIARKLQAGDTSAIKSAVSALSSTQRHIPATHSKPELTPEAKRLANLRREYTRLSTLHRKYMDAARYVSSALTAARQRGERFPRGHDPELAKSEQFIADNRGKLDSLLETFLHSLGFLLDDLTTTTEP